MQAKVGRGYDVNCSILFSELPLRDRPAAVRQAGFGAAEFWWPFDAADPADDEVDGFVAAVRDAEVAMVGLNFYAGDMPSGDRGLVSWPGREDEFRANAVLAARIGQRLGCRMFNALYGNRDGSTTPAEQDDIAIGNLIYAADILADVGGMVLVESVSGADRYPLRTAADARAVVDRVNFESRAGNCRILADLYHLTVNGDDLSAVISKHSQVIGHVQLADAPGRGAPGTGQIDLAAALTQLAAVGYQGWVGLEYKPAGASADSFGWLPRELRAVSAGVPAASEGASR